MQDVCFRVELPLDLYQQFMGGLNPDDIIAFYDNQNSAEEKARHELHASQQVAIVATPEVESTTREKRLTQTVRQLKQ